MEDHLHILCDLHPTIALADYMRDIKTSSSIWLKQSGKFSDFKGWADGYAALRAMPMVIQIKLFQSFRTNVLKDLFQHINYGFIR